MKKRVRRVKEEECEEEGKEENGEEEGREEVDETMVTRSRRVKCKRKRSEPPVLHM